MQQEMTENKGCPGRCSDCGLNCRNQRVTMGEQRQNLRRVAAYLQQWADDEAAHISEISTRWESGTVQKPELDGTLHWVFDGTTALHLEVWGRFKPTQERGR